MAVPNWLLRAAHRSARVRLKLAMAFAPEVVPDYGAATAMKIAFSSHIGMAAGLDRYGSMAHLAHRIGLGFVETGTVTPRPEPGHNHGMDALLKNLERFGWTDAAVRERRARLGISISRNSTTPPTEAWRDLAECMTRSWPVADFFTLNLGSLIPALSQDRGLLLSLLERVKGRQRALQFEHYRSVPIVVKLQLRDDALEETVQLSEYIVAAGFEGILAATGPNAIPPGNPIRLLEHLAGAVNGKAAIISVGGIRSAGDALQRLQVGADLIQIHRALLSVRPTPVLVSGANDRGQAPTPARLRVCHPQALPLDADLSGKARYHDMEPGGYSSGRDGA
jgi:dihydroorotate dehydrogenase